MAPPAALVRSPYDGQYHLVINNEPAFNRDLEKNAKEFKNLPSSAKCAIIGGGVLGGGIIGLSINAGMGCFSGSSGDSCSETYLFVALVAIGLLAIFLSCCCCGKSKS